MKEFMQDVTAVTYHHKYTDTDGFVMNQLFLFDLLFIQSIHF